MSRSIKKNMGGTWVSCKNIKSDRKIYHSNERAKVREQLKSIIDDPKNEELDNKIIKNRIDRDVYFGDPYSWGSDGGSYLLDTMEDLKKSLEVIIKEQDLYEKYLSQKSKNEFKVNWSLSYNRELERSVLVLAPDLLQSREALVSWINMNRNKIFNYYKKVNYGK